MAVINPEIVNTLVRVVPTKMPENNVQKGEEKSVNAVIQEFLTMPYKYVPN